MFLKLKLLCTSWHHWSSPCVIWVRVRSFALSLKFLNTQCGAAGCLLSLDSWRQRINWGSLYNDCSPVACPGFEFLYVCGGWRKNPQNKLKGILVNVYCLIFYFSLYCCLSNFTCVVSCGSADYECLSVYISTEMRLLDSMKLPFASIRYLLKLRRFSNMSNYSLLLLLGDHV